MHFTPVQNHYIKQLINCDSEEKMGGTNRKVFQTFLLTLVQRKVKDNNKL